MVEKRSWHGRAERKKGEVLVQLGIWRLSCLVLLWLGIKLEMNMKSEPTKRWCYRSKLPHGKKERMIPERVKVVQNTLNLSLHICRADTVWGLQTIFISFLMLPDSGELCLEPLVRPQPSLVGIRSRHPMLSLEI